MEAIRPGWAVLGLVPFCSHQNSWFLTPAQTGTAHVLAHPQINIFTYLHHPNWVCLKMDCSNPRDLDTCLVLNEAIIMWCGKPWLFLSAPCPSHQHLGSTETIPKISRSLSFYHWVYHIVYFHLSMVFGNWKLEIYHMNWQGWSFFCYPIFFFLRPSEKPWSFSKPPATNRWVRSRRGFRPGPAGPNRSRQSWCCQWPAGAAGENLRSIPK